MKQKLRLEWTYADDCEDYDDPCTHLSAYMGDEVICDFWGFDQTECLGVLLRKLYNVEEWYLDDSDWGDHEDSN